jgi:PKD repeat protein/glucose/arabinose dehydrogenase
MTDLIRRFLPLLAFFICTSSYIKSQTLPPDFQEALVVGNFTEPVGAVFDGNGRAYVWEKRGMVWIVENGVKLPDPLIDIRPEVGNWRDYGLLGFTIDPDFLNNGYIYLMYAVDRHHLFYFGTPNYSATANDYFDATIVRISRYTAVAPNFNSVTTASRFVLFGESPDSGAALLHESHGPGTLAFGTDGTLLASIGDGATYFSVDVGNAPDTYHTQAIADGIIRPEENVGALRAQMVNSHNGKILRLDPATGDGVASNPWYDPSEPRAPRSRVWVMGVRNAYRFTVRPGSGSTDPMAGEPGSLYIGDVGWNFWEELNVVTSGGNNLGWPLFEGFDVNTPYWNVPTANLDAPNPMFNGVNCTQQYFNFQDLIVQATPVHSNAHPNPCEPSIQIPNSIPKHFHHRPEIDWRHGNQSRTGGFNGNTPVTWNLSDPSSPVPGPTFGGFAAIGGPWMDGLEMPLGYQGATFHGDYAMGWIKRFMFNSEDEPVSVHDFASGLGAVTWIGAGPDGCIWYIRYNTNELRRICYTNAVDLPPNAVATQSVQFGPSPLTVSFTGSGSSDPGGGALTYHWDFGDSDESTSADPTHEFTAPAGVPTTYTVTLTVTDAGGQSASTELIVSLNNTPPEVEITSFPDGLFYPVGVDTTLSLTADVSDAEHGPDELTYAWQISLHHNTHIHPEPVDNADTTSAIISGVGCDGENYSYEVTLTVTDAGGLSTTVQQWLYPACHLIAPTAIINATPTVGFAPLIVQFDGQASFDPGEVVSYFWEFGDGTTSTDPAPQQVFNDVGQHYVTLTVTDNDGLTGTAVRVINVINLDPPQCVGPVGGILREEWIDIPGSSLSSLISHPSYTDPPASTSILPSFQGPTSNGVNYGARYRGYIIPEETGTYVFTVTSDDASIVYLSLNSDPTHKQPIANVPGYTQPMEFDAYTSQVSEGIELQAGVYYYVEALHKQGFGGDHFTLWWQLDGSPRTVVPGTSLAPWEDCSPSIQVRMMLQGALQNNSLNMRDDLRLAGLLPTTEPYTGLGLGPENAGATVPAEMFTVTGLNAIVDWVLVELHDGDTPGQLIERKAALLQVDGDVVGTDGFLRLIFDVPDGDYHVVVRHRNHLGAMTAQPLALADEVALVDFTSSMPTFGTEAQTILSNGKHALWMGNVVNDGMLKYTGPNNDREPILQAIGGTLPTNFISAYSTADTNMDGVVKYMGPWNDRDPILVNIGGLVPVAVRLEQLP